MGKRLGKRSMLSIKLERSDSGNARLLEQSGVPAFINGGGPGSENLR